MRARATTKRCNRFSNTEATADISNSGLRFCLRHVPATNVPSSCHVHLANLPFEIAPFCRRYPCKLSSTEKAGVTMGNPTDAALPQVGADLQKVHSKEDLAHVFQEFSSLATKPEDLKSALASMQQAHVKLPPELKLDGFQVIGFDPKLDHNRGAVFLAGPNQERMALDINGNEYKGTPSPDGKRTSFADPPIASALPGKDAAAATADKPPAAAPGADKPKP